MARHDRCWARHQTITDPDHAAAAAVMRGRAQFAVPPPQHVEVEARDLASYDRVFRVIDGGAAS